MRLESILLMPDTGIAPPVAAAAVEAVADAAVLATAEVVC